MKYAKDCKPEELKGKVICGLSGLVFDSDEEYLNHVSPITGYTPKDPEHFGANFLRQSKKALERTGSLDEKTAKAIDKKIKTVEEKVQPEIDKAKLKF